MLSNRQTNDIASYLDPAVMDALHTGHDSPREWLEEALDGPHADEVREAAISAGITVTDSVLGWVRASRLEGRIVVIDDWTDRDRCCLDDLADDTVGTDEVVEYWADDTGSEMAWRIHLALPPHG